VDAQGAAGGIVETAPIWIRSAPVDAAAGDVLRIHGWAQVPGPITGSVDGLLIIDSIAGPAMAERIGPTGGWREFTLYRVATQPGQLTLTFALTGLGVARLDDITIERLSPPGQSDRAHPRAAPENQASYPIKRLPPVR
jgi:hypothetical protein